MRILPFKYLLYLLIMAITAGSQTHIKPDHPHIRYFGRVDRSTPDRVVFDWPGIAIHAIFQGPSCSVILEGVNAFDVFVDGILTKTFLTTSQKATYEIVAGLTDRNHRLRLIKRSESAHSPSTFWGFILEGGKILIAPPAPPKRKIEFIGDSYTAGFANEYLSRESPAGKDDSIILAATNTNKAFGPLVARAFGAQYHIIAISGKGLIRNYNGIDKGKELPYYYDRTLISSVNNPNATIEDNILRLVATGCGQNGFIRLSTLPVVE